MELIFCGKEDARAVLVHFCVPCDLYYIVHICVRQAFFINFYTQMCPYVLNYLYTHKTQKGETL